MFDYLETPPEHELRTAGARAAWELEVGRQYAGRLGFAAACYFDLEREPDPEVGADVGGVTVLLSVALGIGI